ncbi:hypothetical protein HV824_19460 [Myxococcus sp. AM009]|uniref:hypothetical protein n=1 Tax=unclassified Myxococcus TaxID=2648731 RepID=UPI0015950ED3|nr:MULTISPECIES: hypothetical protein [unclassified Myxococcus]NVJ00286.1 hypothetical protein [Myxococcus sp. AM009]NVJ17863.1 hypothetical protein [Myxococcus sp. AM010]
MTRFAAFFIVLSLIAAPQTAWAQQRQTESAKKTRAVKSSSKTKATKAKATKRKAAKPTRATSKRKPAKKAKKAAPAVDAPELQPAQPMMQVEPARPLSPTDDAPTVQKESGAAAEGGDSLDFDLLEPAEAAAAAQVDPELEKRIGRRRTMLKLHQGLGFAMAAGLVGTTVVGQLQFNDSFRGGGDDRNLLGLHRGLAIGTSALFATVGLLGVLAPEPFEKETFQWDTITVHKLFMALATVGMVAQIVLGIMATDRFGRLSETDLATAHQISGYVTLGAVSAGVFTLFF